MKRARQVCNLGAEQTVPQEYQTVSITSVIRLRGPTPRTCFVGFECVRRCNGPSET